MSAVDLAIRAESDRPAVWRLLWGDRRPGAALSARLKTILGIEPGWWRQRPLRPFTPPPARAA